ncbi:alanine racemase, partial [Planctomycetota bacterium]
SGARIHLVVDCLEHLRALSRAATALGTTYGVVIELDVSLRLPARIHVGVRRSPVRTPDDLVRVARAAASMAGVELRGVMAYEAHLAGVPDRSPFRPLLNPAVRLLKRLAAPRVAVLRQRAIGALRSEGFALELVNGGGSGSLGTTLMDETVTEVTVGSALFAPHLFDYYRSLGGLRPAAFFACQVVRASDPGYVTCHGGGLVASGEAGRDRLPAPWFPEGLELVRLEGAGEVQTPLRTRNADLRLLPGDPVFFRHAKAGELAEHFSEYLLVRGDRVVGRAPTYRGLGLSFL